jgi:hypothetical protein
VTARGVAWCAFVCAVVGLGSSLLWDAVRYDDGSFVESTADLVAIGRDRAGLFRIALLADAAGYLLYLPLVVHLWRDKPRESRAGLSDLGAVSGFAYGLVGAVGAAAFAIAGERLINAHAAATAPDEAGSIAVTFGALSDAVVGLWQLVAALMIGVWWLVVGLELRSRWRWFSLVTIAFAVIGFGTVLLKGAGVDLESTGPATPAFLPLVLWPAWLGWLLLRDERRASPP